MERPELARDIMVTRLVTVTPDTDVSEAIRTLLRHRITGAPVVDEDRVALGVFSEKCCMKVLVAAARRGGEGEIAAHRTLARDFMVTHPVTFTPDMDFFEALGYLLTHGMSGAPVVDEQGQYLGIFSEKTSMSPLIQSAYDQLPTTKVGAFMNTDLQRLIHEDTDLLRCAELFIETSYRRLPIVRDGKVVGQISRRDVIRAGKRLCAELTKVEEGIASPAARSSAVSGVMDTKATTITEDTDLLRVAHIFLTTPYRRLPVLRAGKLVGQLSRRDLLAATHRLMEVTPEREKALLYLSSLGEPHEPRFP